MHPRISPKIGPIRMNATETYHLSYIVPSDLGLLKSKTKSGMQKAC